MGELIPGWNGDGVFTWREPHNTPKKMDNKTRNMLIAGGIGTLALGPLGAAAVAWAAHALTPNDGIEDEPNENNVAPPKRKASEIVNPEDIFQPEKIVKWEFFDRGKKECEFDNYSAFVNMSARLHQGAPFPLEDVIVRAHMPNGKTADIEFPKVASCLFE